MKPFRHELPAFVSNNSKLNCVFLVLTSAITSTTLGFDGSMMNGLNILPVYTEYFTLTAATTSLNTSAVWLGCIIASLVFGKIPDLVGRRHGMFIGSLINVIGAILQAAAQNIAMFVIARIIIGIGTGAASIAGPLYVAETLPLKYRAWGLGLFYDLWYVGGLIAAGVTYGTAKMDSTWAWRLPSALQGIFSLLSVVLVFFTPESPRWLQSQGRTEDALLALAQSHSNGDVLDEDVRVQMEEVRLQLTVEAANDKKVIVTQFMSSASMRKRIYLIVSVAVFSMLSGNNIISYYLGTMLDQAGITNSTTQLEINIILNAFCLVVALLGTPMADKLGRRWLAASSTAAPTILLFMVGGLTKAYGGSTYSPGIYGTIAVIFLFQGSYSFGWTPLTVLYPAEVLNYTIRSEGMAVYTFVSNAVGLFVTFVFPFALDAIGWKTYMINGAWDVLELVFILFYWVETRGRSLEAIDANLEGRVAHIEGIEVVMSDPRDEASRDRPKVQVGSQSVEVDGKSQI